MTTIKLPVEIENLLDSVLYAGAFSTYPWYTTVRPTHSTTSTAHTVNLGGGYKLHTTLRENPQYLIGITPEGESEVQAFVTEARLVEVIQNVIDQRLPRYADIIQAIREDDIDAELADVILQYAVLDDIVLG
jgi:hypothetical protein